jgi:hypothetical protein
MAADQAVQLGSDRVLRALADLVADLALGEDLFAFCRISGCPGEAGHTAKQRSACEKPCNSTDRH